MTLVEIEAGNIQARRERYMKLAVPVRLGELAETLIFAKMISDLSIPTSNFERLVNDSLNCIDWTAPEVAPDVQVELSALRSDLVEWLCDLQDIVDDPLKRESVVAALDEWSQKVLDRSGLAAYDNWQVEFDYPPGIRAAAEVFV